MAASLKTEVIRFKLRGEGSLGNQWWYQYVQFHIYGRMEQFLITCDTRKADQLLIYVGPSGQSHDLTTTICADHGTPPEYRGGTNQSISIPLSDAYPFLGPCGHLALSLTVTIKEGQGTLYSFLVGNQQYYGGYTIKPPTPDCDLCGPVTFPPVPYRPLTNFFKNGMYKKDLVTDFEINVQGKTTFHAHKVVLWSEGKVFEHMIEYEMREGETGTSYVDHCEPEEMRHFLDVLYDRSKMADYGTNCGDVLAIFRIAHKYEVEDIAGRCAKALLRVDIPPEHFCEAMRIGNLYAESVPGLLQRCAREKKNLPDGFWKQQSTVEFLAVHPWVMANFMEMLKLE